MSIMKYEGKTYKLRGLCLSVYSKKDGKMYAREVCSCGGCFDNEYEIQESDVVMAFKHLNVVGKLRKIKLVAMKFTIHNAELEQVELSAHEKAIDWYCGSCLYDNYGIDGGKSFAKGLIESLESDGVKVETNIKFPQNGNV